MNAAEQFCSNVHCPKCGLIGQGNLKLHSRLEGRLGCTECRRTFSATTGTPFFGLKKEAELYQTAITAQYERRCNQGQSSKHLF